MCNTQSPYFDSTNNLDKTLNDSTNVGFKLKNFNKRVNKFAFNSPSLQEGAPTQKTVIENTPEKKEIEPKIENEKTKSVLEDLDEIIYESTVKNEKNPPIERKLFDEKSKKNPHPLPPKAQATLLSFFKYENPNKLGKISK